MEDVIVLFGAGVYARKYKAILDYLGMEFQYFTDNDARKWGEVFYDKPVVSPDRLLQMDCRIVISCTHEDAIKRQLQEMGLQNQILELKELYLLCEKRDVVLKNINSIDENPVIVVDMYEGIGWGGSEMWAAELAYGLQQHGKQVYILGSKEQPPLEEKYERMVTRFSGESTVIQIAEFIAQKLPCTFINNFAGGAFVAASVVKQIQPDEIKIISVIHNEKKNLIDAHWMMRKYINAFFCVSRRIQRCLIDEYAEDARNVFYREQPIKVEKDSHIEYGKVGKVRIGYAGRLVKQQKRADLLPKLVECLEEKKVDYLFQIAGWGESADDITDYIKENGLGDKVNLLGRLPKIEMGNFWKEQEVIVNISEYEGSSLSMLEAMSYGCVPVVTDVSGVREFIQHRKNGLICDIGDLEGMAAYIQELSLDLAMLENYGRICRGIIEERCNPEEYIKFWLNTLI